MFGSHAKGTKRTNFLDRDFGIVHDLLAHLHFEECATYLSY